MNCSYILNKNDDDVLGGLRFGATEQLIGQHDTHICLLILLCRNLYIYIFDRYPYIPFKGRQIYQTAKTVATSWWLSVRSPTSSLCSRMHRSVIPFTIFIPITQWSSHCFIQLQIRMRRKIKKKNNTPGLISFLHHTKYLFVWKKDLPLSLP